MRPLLKRKADTSLGLCLGAAALSDSHGDFATVGLH